MPTFNNEKVARILACRTVPCDDSVPEGRLVMCYDDANNYFWHGFYEGIMTRNGKHRYLVRVVDIDDHPSYEYDHIKMVPDTNGIEVITKNGSCGFIIGRYPRNDTYVYEVKFMDTRIGFFSKSELHEVDWSKLNEPDV